MDLERIAFLAIGARSCAFLAVKCRGSCPVSGLWPLVSAVVRAAFLAGEAFLRPNGVVWPPHVCTDVHAEIKRGLASIRMTADTPFWCGQRPEERTGTLRNA